MMRTPAAAIAILVLLSAGPATAGAASAADVQKEKRPDPAASGVINVPDLQGCVKWCLRDTNPCDPPSFKWSDGRCQEP